MSEKKTIWISYDLGLRGDYTGLYNWLDTNNAKECGDNLAFFTREVNQSDLKKEIKDEISSHVKLNPSDRIYLIFREGTTDKLKGVFLFGGRKMAPWQGYSTKVLGTEEDSI